MDDDMGEGSSGKKKQYVMVFTEPTEGMEDEFNDYYENLHLDEVLKTTGWKTAQRFKLVDEAGKECPWPYLAFYETESDDAASAIEVLNSSRKDRQQSRALNKKTAGLWVFEEIGPEHS